MVLKSRKVHLLASYILRQLVWCNHGMFERSHLYTPFFQHAWSMLFNKYPVKHVVMRICASQRVSLLIYSAALYWQSVRGGYTMQHPKLNVC